MVRVTNFTTKTIVKNFNKKPKNMLLEPTRTKIFRKSDLLEINECMYFIQSLRSFLLNLIYFPSIYNHKFSERNIWIIFCIISGLGTHFRAKILLFCWSVQKSSEFRIVCWANLINLFCVPKRKSSKLTKAKVNWISWEQFSSQTDSFKIYIEMGKIIKTKIAKIYILVLFKPPFRHIHHQWSMWHKIILCDF